MTVWVVTRGSADCSVRMVEIMGVFTTRPAAERKRQALWDKHKVSAMVETFLTMDDLFPAAKKASKPKATKAEKAEGKR
jgi:hypothetical protein